MARRSRKRLRKAAKESILVIGDLMIDTTVAVAHLRGIAAVGERLIQAQTRYLSTVALGELHFGLWLPRLA
jgi:hypothetical protein